MRCLTVWVLIFFVTLSSSLFGELSTAEISLDRHDPMRFSSEIGYQQGRGTFIATQYRYALHDLLDPRGNFPHATAIEILSAKWRVHFENTRPWLDELTFFRVTRVPVYSANSGEWSWNFDTGLRTSRENFCANCLAGHVRGGVGLTEAPFRGIPLEIYLLADAEMSLAPGASDSFQPALGPRLGVRLWSDGNWKALTELRYRYFFLSVSPNVFEATASVRYFLGWNSAVETRIARFADGWEYALGIYVYF